MQKLNVCHYDRRGRKRYLTLRFFDNGEIFPRDAEKWARSVASEWGEVNSQRKVRVPELPGPAWWFDCSGHAGYILVASANEVPKELARFAADGILVWDTSWVKQFGDQFNRITVFRFEEDCDWSVLEVLYPEVARWSVCDIERGWAKAEYLDKNRALLAQQRLQSPEEIDLLVVKRLQTACKSIREWQPPEVTEKLLDLAKSA